MAARSLHWETPGLVGLVWSGAFADFWLTTLWFCAFFSARRWTRLASCMYLYSTLGLCRLVNGENSASPYDYCFASLFPRDALQVARLTGVRKTVDMLSQEYLVLTLLRLKTEVQLLLGRSQHFADLSSIRDLMTIRRYPAYSSRAALCKTMRPNRTTSCESWYSKDHLPAPVDRDSLNFEGSGSVMNNCSCFTIDVCPH
jgi:hypothetical protein